MDIDIDPALDALGDPMRRRIVGRLAAGPLDVGGIAAGMPVGRTAVSMHLRVLKAAGLVSDQADGNRRVYHLLLVQGNFRIDLTETTITLEKQGDYAAWGPGIGHSWEAISDSVVSLSAGLRRWRSPDGLEPISRSAILVQPRRH